MKYMQLMVKNAYGYRFLLTQLITRDIKLKYRRSYLGVFWSLFEPLMTMIVLTFVFGTILGRGDEYFPIYVLSGRLLYNYFSTGTKSAMKSIRKNAAMIKKVYIPKYMYPLSSCMSSYVISLISLVDLLLVILVMRMEITPYLLLSVIPILTLFFLVYGIGMILATMNVYFRDIEYIWDVALMLIMYTCAIFYKVDAFQGSAKFWAFRLNPLYAIIRCFRDCIYGNPMELNWILYAIGFSLITCVFGTWIFKKKQDLFILHV